MVSTGVSPDYRASMRRRTDTRAAPASSTLPDWAEALFRGGWKPGMPWIVVEQIWPSLRRFDRLLSQSRGGWGFELVSFRVLHAPLFDVFAPETTARGIIDSIRAYPAQRAAGFQAEQLATSEGSAYPEAVVQQLKARLDEPLMGTSFHSPVLLVTSQPGAHRYALAGAASSLDPVLKSLVARDDVKIDQALELMILVTCHGNPGDAGIDRTADALAARSRKNQSAFLKPFHPKRFKQVMSALRVRTAGDSRSEHRAELYRLLSTRIRDVIESLRRNPPRPDKKLHSVAKSRLAEFVSNELGLSRKRAVRTPWWRKLDDWTESERRSFFRSLTPAQRAALHSARHGKMKKNGPSTPRVLLARAKIKFENALRERRRKPT